MVEERHLIPLIHRIAQATQDSQLPRVPWGHAWPSGGLLWGSTHHFLKDAPAAHSLSLLEHWGWSLQFWLAVLSPGFDPVPESFHPFLGAEVHQGASGHVYKTMAEECPESSMSTSAFVSTGGMSMGLHLGKGQRNICVLTAAAAQAQAAAAKPLQLGWCCPLTAGINIVTGLHIWQAV